MFCEKHDPIVSDKCAACEREDRKALLAAKLALFLGSNEVESYVSPSGYKLKIVTQRQAMQSASTLWHQARKEEVA